MGRLRKTLFSSLASALFFITVACGGQPTLPTPTPTQSVLQSVIQSPSGVINSIRDYKPTESEIKTAEAVRYIQKTKYENVLPYEPSGIPFNREMSIYHDTVRISNSNVIFSVYDGANVYDVAIPSLDNQELNKIKTHVLENTTVQIKRPPPNEYKSFPSFDTGRVIVGSPVRNIGVPEKNEWKFTIVADKNYVVFSPDQILPSEQQTDIKLQAYPEDISKRAIILSNLMDASRDDIVLRAVQGDPYTFQELQQSLNTSPYELSVLLDDMFDGVYLFNVDEKEMVEFRNATDSYREFKDATGLGAQEYADIDPNMKAAIVYATIFTVRSIHQDPITAHKYAFAIAKDPETREGTYEIAYDIYFYGKEGVEKAVVKLGEIETEDLPNKVKQTISDKLDQAKQKILDEAKQKAEEEWKKNKEETQQQIEELKRKAEEELRKRTEELRQQEEEQRRKARETLEKAREKAEETVCENWPSFIPKPEDCK